MSETSLNPGCLAAKGFALCGNTAPHFFCFGKWGFQLCLGYPWSLLMPSYHFVQSLFIFTLTLACTDSCIAKDQSVCSSARHLFI